MPDVGQKAVIMDQITQIPAGSTKRKGQERDGSCGERLEQDTDSLEDRFKDKQEAEEMHREWPPFSACTSGHKATGSKDSKLKSEHWLEYFKLLLSMAKG